MIRSYINLQCFLQDQGKMTKKKKRLEAIFWTIQLQSVCTTVSVMVMVFCTFAAAAAAPPLTSPASVWSRAYSQPQPSITGRDRKGEKTCRTARGEKLDFWPPNSLPKGEKRNLNLKCIHRKSRLSKTACECPGFITVACLK